MRYTVRNTAGEIVVEVERDSFSLPVEHVVAHGETLIDANLSSVYFRGANLIDDNTTDKITDQ